VAASPAPQTHLLPPKRRHGALRSLLVMMLASVGTTVAVLAPSVPAQATPTADSVQKQIDSLNNQIETVVEQYNGVHAKLGKDQTTSKLLAKTLGPAKLQATFAQTRISEIAGNIYMTGPASGLAALLDAGSTESLVNQLGALNTIAKNQSATVTSASAVVDKYQAQQNKLTTLIASEAVQDKQLAAKKKDILARLSQLNKLQVQLLAVTRASGGTSSGGTVGTGSKTSKSYVEPVACPQQPGSGGGRTAALKACSLVWSDTAPHIHWYHWGSAGPSTYDCSGMTMTAWAAAGVSLDHFTGGQYKETNRVTRAQLQVGDLVFYYSDHHHVALYIGNGYIAQAEHTGEPLKVSPIGSPSAYGRPHS
jgi:cell wall-associated NlpC family hydrolase